MNEMEKTDVGRLDCLEFHFGISMGEKKFKATLLPFILFYVMLFLSNVYIIY